MWRVTCICIAKSSPDTGRMWSELILIRQHKKTNKIAVIGVFVFRPCFRKDYGLHIFGYVFCFKPAAIWEETGFHSHCQFFTLLILPHLYFLFFSSSHSFGQADFDANTLCLFLSGAWKTSPDQKRWHISAQTVDQWEEYFLTDVRVFTECVSFFLSVFYSWNISQFQDDYHKWLEWFKYKFKDTYLRKLKSFVTQFGHSVN